MLRKRFPFIPFDNWNLGGLADSKWSGAKFSSAKMVGWNPHQVPGVLRVAQRMINDSGINVTEFCKNSFPSVNGRKYWFSSESGKIWMKDINGSYILVYTIALNQATEGESKILGAYEYQNYIYIATEKYLHRISSSVATTQTEWTTNLIIKWAAFTNGDKSFHPMRDQNLVLYIGDGSLLAQVDAGTFSPNALDIAAPLRIKSLGRVATDLLIGTYISDNVNKTELFRWNTYSVSFQVTNKIDEVGINAFLETDDFIYVQAGLSGRIYVYDYTNNRLQGDKTIPGEYSPAAFCTVHPDAVATIDGIALFGVSNSLGDPCDQGTYAIGRHSRNYPYILDMPYPISERNPDGSFVLSGIEIGTILVSGFDVYVHWRRTVNGVVTVGIDRLDYTQKLNGSYLESRVMMVYRVERANFNKFIVAYAKLPDQTQIQISYSRNYGSYQLMDARADPDECLVYAEERVDAAVLQMRIQTTVNGNLAPELESAGIKFVW